jgi:hypothetical protein
MLTKQNGVTHYRIRTFTIPTISRWQEDQEELIKKCGSSVYTITPVTAMTIQKRTTSYYIRSERISVNIF